MIDYDNNDSLYFAALVPGIKKYGDQFGCQFYWDGFIPAFRKGENQYQLDMAALVSLAKDDKYSELSENVKAIAGSL